MPWSSGRDVFCLAVLYNSGESVHTLHCAASLPATKHCVLSGVHFKKLIDIPSLFA